MQRNFYNGMHLGPLMREEAEFLQAIIKLTTPKVLVEFGYFTGDSARAMLEVMDKDAVLHSFDNTRSPESTNNFIFHEKCQTEVEGIEDIDFVFLDASHDPELNMITLQRIMPYLSPKAIIAVHDTGTWVGGDVFNYGGGELLKDGTYAHCLGEIQFIQDVRDKYPEFEQIHFHSSRQVRHGITLLQRYSPK